MCVEFEEDSWGLPVKLQVVVGSSSSMYKR